MKKTMKKKGWKGGEPRKGYMKMPCTLSKVKLQARAMVHTSPIQDYRWPSDHQKALESHSNATPGNATRL